MEYHTTEPEEETQVKPIKACDSELNNNEDSGSPKPGMSYIALISLAIQSTPSRKMLLSEIYSWITENYPYYKMEERSWRNSIRHNLSLNECFVKSGRCENGKGNFWSIHPANIDDFSNGDFRRRRARRRVRKCDEELQKLVSCEDDADDDSSISEEPCCTIVPSNAYVPMTGVWVTTEYLVSLYGANAIMSQEERVEYYNRVDVPKEYTTQQTANRSAYVRVNSDSDQNAHRDICHPGFAKSCHSFVTQQPYSGIIAHPSGFNHSSTVSVNVNVNVQGVHCSQKDMLPTWHDTFSRLKTDMYCNNY